MDRPPSFVMLETIREYAQECLERSGEAPALRRRFASYFHVTGGTLPLNTGSYVVRQADVDLHEALSRGELCTVLTNRQMGKSSLMVRTAVRLRQEGAAVAIADLTAIRGNQTAEEWHLALLDRIGQQLDIEGKLEEVWLAQAHRGLRERWMAALREVALPAVGVRCSVFGVRTGPAPSRTEHRTPNTDRPCRLVLFIDEIDAVRALPFSPDDLFAVIRECYDRRAEEPEFYRLTFCLLGVAAPDELIRDPHATPFDIGRRIVLKDFTEAEAASLIPGLGRPEPLGRVLLQRVLYWTAGHPYLTLRLCRAVAEEAAVTGPAGVDRVCDALLLSPRARERDDNLLFVRARLLQSPGDAVGDLLALYRQVLHGQRVPDDRTNPLINLLQLSGIVGGVDGHLRVRNRIYERVFDREWVDLDLSGRREQGSPR